jgi:7-cyano-7-deazaguanine reductase
LPGLETQQFTALGNKVTEGDLESVDISSIVTQVTMTSDEVTALCPVTGQPDYYQVCIIFRPLRRSIESKSLKLYLQKYRERGIFAENLAALICFDVYRIIEPEWCNVTVVQKSRGGVVLTAYADSGAVATLGAVRGD